MDLIKKLKTNPDNPRYLKKDAYERLKKKIQEFPEMLEKRPIVYDENFMVLGGNMRLEVLRNLVNEGFEIKEEYFKSAEGWTDEQKRKFVILDNIADGQWDWDIIGNKWDDLPLEEWGLIAQDLNFDPEEEWEGMPGFDGTPIIGAFKSLQVYFINQDDIDTFAELVGQKITEKTKYIWFPKKEKEDIKSMTVKSEK